MAIASDIVDRARAALDRGDAFAAYDIAATDDSGDPDLVYLRVLALARLGDWRSALSLYGTEGLDRHGDVDSLALKARLLKDKAFDSSGAERTAILRDSRDAYHTAFERTGEDFAAINAASLSLMIGDSATGRELAQTLLDRSAGSRPTDYWHGATRAEALMVLARFDEARVALAEAAALPDASAAARSSTFQQLRRLLAATGMADTAVVDDLLQPIRPRRVAHFCGHMFRAGEEVEARLAATVADAFRAEDVGMAFGALACGADILIAEQALALGIQLHVVFPFDKDDFVRQSVVPGGGDWRARFERCAAAATATYIASPMRFVNDDEQFAFGSRTAMGMARLRASQAHAETVQIAVCDDEIPRGVAGTAADIATWQSAGGRTCRLSTMGAQRPARSAGMSGATADRESRALRVLVFADFQGFSRLPEQLIPQFWQTIMAGCAKALEPHAEAILAINTWGDGLHLVFDRVEAAAPALLDLRETLLGLDLAQLGIAGDSGMRIAAHFGSVYEMVDPVTGRLNFYGTEVSRAARLEPVTPPGKIYTTEPMAAAVEMSCADTFRSRYVGRLSLPKNFGTERIYALDERRPR
jgi:hypothetical protein